MPQSETSLSGAMPSHSPRNVPVRCSSVIGADGRRLGSGESVKVEPFTFGQGERLSSYALRRISRMHEEYAALVEAQSSLSLRTEAAFTVKNFALHRYEDAVADLGSPLHLTLFRAAPLTGIGLLGVDTMLALTVANLTLGGKGDAPKEARPLTRIETDLTAELFQNWLNAWSGLWRSASECHAEVIGHESEIDALRICDSNTQVLKLELKVKLHKAVGSVFLLVPFHMVASLVEAMEQSRPTDQAVPKRTPSAWSSQYNHVPMPALVSVALGRMSVGEFNQVKPGDILTLPEGTMEQAVLRLAGKPVFKGQFGVSDDRLALSIDQKL